MPPENRPDVEAVQSSLPKRAREAAVVAAQLASETDEAIARAVLDGASVGEIAEATGLLHAQAAQIVAGRIRFSEILFAAAAAGSLSSAGWQRERVAASSSNPDSDTGASSPV